MLQIPSQMTTSNANVARFEHHTLHQAADCQPVISRRTVETPDGLQLGWIQLPHAEHLEGDTSRHGLNARDYREPKGLETRHSAGRLIVVLDAEECYRGMLKGSRCDVQGGK